VKAGHECNQTEDLSMPLQIHSGMKYLLPIVLFSLFVMSPKSQTNLDSLWDIWTDESKADTVRIKAIRKFAWDGYLYSHPESCFYYSQIQYDFAQSKGLKMQMIDALNAQGASFFIRSDFPKALEYYQKGMTLSEEVGDNTGVATSLNNMGHIYYEQGSYSKALQYYEKSLVIDEKLDRKHGVAYSLISIGNVYLMNGNFLNALENYQKGLTLQEELGDKSGIALTLHNMGIAYKNQENYPKALEHYHKSMEIYEELGSKQGIASALSVIATIYRELGDYSQAMEYNQKGLLLFEELTNGLGTSGSLNNIGLTYLSQKVYPKALEYCKRGLDLAEQLEVLFQQKIACQCLYDTYKAMGKGNDALVYLEKLRSVEDSLKSKETTKKLQQMEFAAIMLQDSIAKAEEARLVQEAHREEMQKEEKIRNISLGFGAIFVLLALGFYSRWRYVRKSRDIISKERDRSENLLLNILPAEIAAELKAKGRADARDFDTVSILFTDFKGFTEQSAKLSAQDLVSEINSCFEAFDAIIGKHKIEKIKTIGDAYMAAGGLPVPKDDSVRNTVLAALDMQDFIRNRKALLDGEGKPGFEMRVGIHTGPVVAGIVGVKKFQYDIWGDTVNTASRMESSGEEGKVNVSQSTYELLKDDRDFVFESRGKVEAKGKGKIEMYFVSRT
jgi:adenylate cyclase